MKGFTLIELLMVVLIIGILSAVAVPIHINYVVRANMSEVILTMSVCKNSITEASQTVFSRVPTTGAVFSCQTSSYKVAVSNVDENGVISIQTQNIPHLGAKNNLELVPYSDAAMTNLITASDFLATSGKAIKAWKCRPKQDTTGIDIRYLPTSCR